MCSSAAGSMRSWPKQCSTRRGRKAIVLERTGRSAALRTDEATAPGFLHDVMATTLDRFRTSPAYQALGKDLEARGFAFPDTNLPNGRASAGRIERHPLDGSRAQREDVRRARRGRRARLRGRDGALARTRHSSSRSWAAPVVRRSRQDDRARALAPRPAPLAEWSGEALAPRAAILRRSIVGCGPRSLGAVGAAHRPRTRERLFGGDGESDRLRHRGGGLSDSGGRRARRWSRRSSD